MKYNRGFTLAELLMALAIVGVLTATALITFKPFDKGIKYLHSNTFYALNRAYYNMINYYVPENEDTRDPFLEENKSIGPKLLCQGLVHYMNVIDNDSCHANAVSKDTLLSGDFSGEIPQFTAVNGVRFYISERLGSKEITPTGQKGVYFYLIFADINGTRFPNSGVYVPADPKAGRNVTKDPDVFTFAAFDGYEDEGDNAGISADAQLIPIGISEFEQRYMPTRIIYTDDDSDSYIRYSRVSQPYYISKCEAWGYYNDSNNKNGEKYSDSDPSKIRFLIDDPHTFNDYVRGVLNKNEFYKNSFILTNLDSWAKAIAKLNNRTNFNPTGNSCDKPIRNGSHYNSDENYKCGVGDDFSDSCSIVIDKYVY